MKRKIIILQLLFCFLSITYSFTFYKGNIYPTGNHDINPYFQINLFESKYKSLKYERTSESTSVIYYNDKKELTEIKRIPDGVTFYIENKLLMKESYSSGNYENIFTYDDKGIIQQMDGYTSHIQKHYKFDDLGNFTNYYTAHNFTKKVINDTIYYYEYDSNSRIIKKYREEDGIVTNFLLFEYIDDEHYTVTNTLPDGSKGEIIEISYEEW